MISNQLKNQHLLWRAGFGPRSSDLLGLIDTNYELTLDSLFRDSAAAPKPVSVQPVKAPSLITLSNLTTEERRMALRQARVLSRERIKELNIRWLDEMVSSNQQLREKMAFFWHGHFASRNLNLNNQQQLLDLIRNHAIGNFKVLLKEVCKSASIITFLNNNQNRKGYPNENFARELMELFTLGRGMYTETDVKEIARAFTGWTVNPEGNFILRKAQHDTGSKIIFNKTAVFDGEQVLDLILERKDTSTFIVTKLYRFFVNEEINSTHIVALSKQFYDSGYEIGPLMRSMFSASWFYDSKHIGARIKSPIELIVGMRRMLSAHFINPESQLLVQKLLGQVLFYPPNVAGWPGGKNWIDSSSLMLRLGLPAFVNGSVQLERKPKSDDDIMMGITSSSQNNQQLTGKNRNIADINWQDYAEHFKGISRSDLPAFVNACLLQGFDLKKRKELYSGLDESSRSAYISSLSLRLMSLPEYQMC